MSAGVVVAAADREYSEHLVGAPQARCDLVGGAVAADRDDEVVIVIAQALGDVHGVARGLGAMKVDIEARQPQCGLKLVPLLDRKAIAGVRVEDAGDARHEAHRTGFRLEYSQYKK